MLLRRVALLSVAVCCFSSLASAQPKTELLWPNGAPGANGTEAKDKPMLIIYSPEKEKNCGAAVVVCPGGGYGGLAMDHEGKQIGEWLNSHGITAVICDYRHRGKGYGHPAPLQDVQRAIRTTRSRAAELGIEPTKIGVLGFSAGGHLASTAVTHFDAGDEKSADPIDRVSSRPDFGVLCYAVIAFDQPFTHKGSQKNLLGAEAAPELVASLSNEKQVTPQTPPCFLWHTYEDTGVPPQNSIVFYQAMLQHKVPGELHVYEKGRHGVGLGKSIPGTGDWSEACLRWLKGRELVK
ncbi:Acetylxylan esterase precursor [Anatilimnocola aggregata]|uniref:Acetylxylan esterase n=1 Tax=Anatilimnocola aggregata TaxID=2528021 RepID=A0A517YIY7_9BACT|nr:alpha/beta hydrolase [Anatilimnocola aggregata]QDU30189.1 Acetylxylan esterase precursor [Anatilimnocola aggregata]